MSIFDAIFESISGLTTTGATVITGIDALPTSILFYRQQLQWMGGMGIIVLAVAILPMLGIGGMQLYRAETPGPMKDAKLTPRITETAKALWYIYLGLTIVCALAYLLAGMSLFDAIGHSFSTVAIGGFSTHDQSISYFDNQAIETIAVVFMLLSGINFSLHFIALRSRSARPYWGDSEFKAYIAVLGTVCTVMVLTLIVAGTYGTPGESFRHGVFSSGFHRYDYGLFKQRLSRLARLASGIVVVHELCRRLRRVYRRRFKGDQSFTLAQAGDP